MKNALVAPLTLVLLLLMAAPALAGGDGHGRPDDAVSAGADIDPDDDAEHGTDPATFVALFVGGAALTAAVSALVMAGQRVPK